jgi:hypothetical protein
MAPAGDRQIAMTMGDPARVRDLRDTRVIGQRSDAMGNARRERGRYGEGD